MAKPVFGAKRMFGLYVLVELAVLIGLTYAIGLGWTLLLVVATFAVGLALAGSQLTRQVQRLRSGLATPARGVSDGVLIALGIVLTVVPGLVTSVLGLALLFPPTRALARPAVAALAARGLGRAPLLVVTTTGGLGPVRPVRPDWPVRTDYVDGEVIDVSDEPQGPPAPPRNLPARPQ